jgi:hypothetical protein
MMNLDVLRKFGANSFLLPNDSFPISLLEQRKSESKESIQYYACNC